MVFHDRPRVRAAVGRVRHEPVAVITGFIQIVRHLVRDLRVRHSRWRSLPSTSSPMWPCTGFLVPYGAVLAMMLDFNTESARQRRAQTNRRHLAAIRVSLSAARAGPPQMSLMAARYAVQSQLSVLDSSSHCSARGSGRQTSNNWGHYELVRWQPLACSS
jgi:hypothetical protein